MKSIKVKFVGLILGLICVISVIALSIMFIQNKSVNEQFDLILTNPPFSVELDNDIFLLKRNNVS